MLQFLDPNKNDTLDSVVKTMMTIWQQCNINKLPYEIGERQN